jgi:type IV pilus biogenesis protein PilP
MITRTTLKTVWLAGGGVIATWLAVAPNRGATGTPQAPTPQQSASVQQTVVEDLSEQADRLRARTQTAQLRQSTRNPFRFTPPSAARNGQPSHGIAAPAPALPPLPLAPPPPSLTLSGVAETKTADGVERTAVITSNGQLYLVRVGDTVGGQYTVVSIDPEAVVLRQPSGEELRLALRQ